MPSPPRCGRAGFASRSATTSPRRVGAAALDASRDAPGGARSTADGEPRDGAWVAELTDRVDLSGWPRGDTPDRPPGAPPPRRPAPLHRPGRPPLPVLPHRPARATTSPRLSSATACTRASRTGFSRVTGRSGSGQAALPRLRRQPGLVRARRCSPRTCSPGCGCSSSTGQLASSQAQAAPPPPAPRRRPPHTLRPAPHAPPATRTGPGPMQLLAAFARLRALPAPG